MASILLLTLVALALTTWPTAWAQNGSSNRTISGVALSSDAPGTLTVQWTAPGQQPDDYRVNYTRADEDYPSYTQNFGNAYPTEPSIELSGLDEGVEYKVHVRARYSNGSGPWSADARLTVMVSEDDESNEDDPPPSEQQSSEDSPPLVVNTELLYHDDISEAGHDSVLLVTVDGDFEDDIAMPIRFTPQGGADGSDYSITYPGGFANGNITFTPSHKSAVFQINPVDDAIDDDGEYILIEMEVPRGAIAQGPTSYMVNIIDNDHPAPEDEDCKNRNSAPGPQNCRMDVGELFNGAIGYGGDVDVIYVDGVKPNHTLQVDVLGNGLPDPYVYGFATDDDSGNGNDARAIWKNTLSKTVSAVFYVQGEQPEGHRRRRHRRIHHPRQLLGRRIAARPRRQTDHLGNTQSQWRHNGITERPGRRGRQRLLAMANVQRTYPPLEHRQHLENL